MKKLIRIILGLAVFLLLVVLAGYLLPAKWEMYRMVVIRSTTDKIYPYLYDLKEGWPQWSVFDQEDPQAVYTYSGAERGIGASRSWVSKKMGNGSQTIFNSAPSGGIDFDVVMTDNNYLIHGKITMNRVVGGIILKWEYWNEPTTNPLYRWLNLFMDKILGPKVEKSLENLKLKVESTP